MIPHLADGRRPKDAAVPAAAALIKADHARSVVGRERDPGNGGRKNERRDRRIALRLGGERLERRTVHERHHRRKRQRQRRRSGLVELSDEERAARRVGFARREAAAAHRDHVGGDRRDGRHTLLERVAAENGDRPPEAAPD